VKKNEPFSCPSQGQAETIVAEIVTLSKPIKKFLLTLFSQWWRVLGRYNFINMSRYMDYSEQALRNGFEQEMDFFQINTQLVKQHCSGYPIPANEENKIIHIALPIGSNVLMANDIP
jgi:hypothetical protein